MRGGAFRESRDTNIKSKDCLAFGGGVAQIGSAAGVSERITSSRPEQSASHLGSLLLVMHIASHPNQIRV